MCSSLIIALTFYENFLDIARESRFVLRAASVWSTILFIWRAFPNSYYTLPGVGEDAGG